MFSAIHNSTFAGFGEPIQLGGRVVATPIFPPKVGQKSKMKNKHHIHNLDFSVFSPLIDR